jgi:hypothetical protein
MISLAVAAIMRWASASWRAISIGFAASIVGAGAATVLFSVISRTPVG